MRSAAEVKVGAITLLALALLGVFIFYVRGYRVAAQTYQVCVIFDNAHALQIGDPVRLAGVKIGEVGSVSINPDLKAEVMLTIYRSPNYTLYDDYNFRITTSGLIQERYIDVIPEARTPYSKELKGGERVNGTAAPELSDFLDAGLGMLDSLRRTSIVLQKVLANEEVVNSVITALHSFTEVSDAAVEVAKSTRALADESRPRVLAAVDRFTDAVADMRAVTHQLQQQLARGGTFDDVRAAVASARQTTENTARITAAVAEAISDPQNRLKARETLDALHDMALSLKETSDNLRFVSEQLREAAPAVPKVAARAESAVADFDAIRERLKPPQIDAAFDVLYSPVAERSFSSGRLDIKTSDERFLRLGVDDIGEQSAANVQLGDIQKRAVVRYGLVRSRLGVGLDLPLPRDATLSLDLFDPNDLRGDALFDVPMVLGRASWGLLAGVRDIGQDNLFVAGVRLRK